MVLQNYLEVNSKAEMICWKLDELRLERGPFYNVGFYVDRSEKINIIFTKSKSKLNEKNHAALYCRRNLNI